MLMPKIIRCEYSECRRPFRDGMLVSHVTGNGAGHKRVDAFTHLACEENFRTELDGYLGDCLLTSRKVRIRY